MTFDLSGDTPKIIITNNSTILNNGGILTAAITAGGITYAIGDRFNISGTSGVVGTGTVTNEVGGVPTQITINTPGTQYILNSEYLTTTITGSGTGLTIRVTALLPLYSDLNWWFYITTPSGLPIHGVDLNTTYPYPTPDQAGTNWTPQSFNILTPFGDGICAQPEFSPNGLYSVTVFVQDESASPPVLYQLLKQRVLVSPPGNNQAGSNLPNSCGYFGSANVSLIVDCAANTIQTTDNTNLIYNGWTPASSTNQWTLVSPPPSSSTVPTTTTVNNQPSVTFTPTVDSDNYSLYFQEIATYTPQYDTTYIIQFKLFNCSGTGLGLNFAFNCNTSYCNIICEMQKLYELANNSAGTVQNVNVMNKISLLTPLMFQLIMGTMQPACGVNIPALIKKINRIGGFGGDCGCGSNSNATIYGGIQQ